MFHSAIRPMISGMLRSAGALLKCWSIACAPASSRSNPSQPSATAIGRPIADHME